MKVTILMGQPELKKHSTRFKTTAVEQDKTELNGGSGAVLERFKPEFYIPEPFMDAKRLRVTIEQIE
jgi:hypothetical protein